MKKPFHLVTVMIFGGLVLFAVDLIAVQFIKSSPIKNFWWAVAFVTLLNAVIIACCSIFAYREGVRRGCGRMLQPEYLQHGKRFKITNSLFDDRRGMTYVFLYMGPYHKICTVPYKLSADATHLLVIETGVVSRFESINVVPEDVRVVTP